MKKTLLRLTLALLSLLLCLSSLAACASKGETLLTLEKDGIKVTLSANEYQLMLTRVKGTLSQYQYDVNSYTFWAQQDKYDGTNFQTLDQFYKDSVLNNCRTYLVALYLFEKEGLELSDASIESVQSAAARFPALHSTWPPDRPGRTGSWRSAGLGRRRRPPG